MSFKKHSDLCLINSGIDYMLNMHVDARAQDEIRKRQFSEVPKWGNRRRWDLSLGQFGENGEGGGWGGGGGGWLVLSALFSPLAPQC